jgi:hypothetical protein
MPLYILGSPDKLARRRRFFKSRSLVDCRADEKFSIVRHKRFIDEDPEFLFVPAPRVLAVATQTGAVPYDVPAHVGEFCNFDAFLKRYQLTDPALTQLAAIVRGADTGRPELALQAAGLLPCRSAFQPYSRMITSCCSKEWLFMTRSTHGARSIPGRHRPRRPLAARAARPRRPARRQR